VDYAVVAQEIATPGIVDVKDIPVTELAFAL
jgi:hypothetical protein